jgi:hypothetical protein
MILTTIKVVPALASQSQLLRPARAMPPASLSGGFQPCNLMRGEKADVGLALCPFKLVQAYPHGFVGRARSEKVSPPFAGSMSY